MRSLLAICAAPLLCLTGCLYPTDPVWTPDSGSFVFKHADGSIIQYDLKKGASRKLTQAPGREPCGLTISPDGDRVAMASAGWWPTGGAAVITIHRLSDGAQVQSRVLEWGNPSPKGTIRPSAAHWCPSGKRILIYYAAGERSDRLETLLYDVAANTLRQFSSQPPAALLCNTLRVTPIRPDGTGYLAGLGSDAEVRLWFVDWEGWAHKIEIAPELADLYRQLNVTRKTEEAKQPDMLLAPRGLWEGAALTFAAAEGIVRIDTERKVAVYVRNQQEAKRRKELVAEGVRDTAPLDGDRYQVQYRQQVGGGQLALVEPAAGRSRVLMENVETALLDQNPLVPSPDGKHVLLRVLKGKQIKIVVIGKDGEIVAEIDAGES